MHTQVAAVAKLLKSKDHGLQAVNLGTGKGGCDRLSFYLSFCLLLWSVGVNVCVWCL